jgi:hypothetical protein
METYKPGKRIPRMNDEPYIDRNDINVNRRADVCKVAKEQKKLGDKLRCSDLITRFRGRRHPRARAGC